MSVADLIPNGKNNAITREMLIMISGKSDRICRAEIEEARKQGEIIINDQDGNGYYKPCGNNMVAELRRQYKQNDNRAMAILVQQKHIRRKLKQLGEVI